MVGLQPRVENVKAPPPEVGAVKGPAEASNAAAHAAPYDAIRAPWHIRHARLIGTTSAAVLVIGAVAYIAYDAWLMRSLERVMTTPQPVVPASAPVTAPEPARAAPAPAQTPARAATAPAQTPRPSPPVASRPAPAAVATPAPASGPRPPSITHTQRDSAAAPVAATPVAAAPKPASPAPAVASPVVCTEGVAALGLCTPGK